VVITTVLAVEEGGGGTNFNDNKRTVIFFYIYFCSMFSNVYLRLSRPDLSEVHAYLLDNSVECLE
jgi:hypothetical protein